MFQRLDGVREANRCLWVALTPFILQKSRMRRRARTDLCGGRSAMVVPTATTIHPVGNYLSEQMDAGQLTNLLASWRSTAAATLCSDAGSVTLLPPGLSPVAASTWSEPQPMPS